MHPQLQFTATSIGSFPYTDSQATCRLIAQKLPLLPVWPQLPRRAFLENMYAQYSQHFPNIRLDHQHHKITFDTTGDFSDAFAAFYENYVADDLDAFALSPDYAAGFFDILDALADTPGDWIKGQVTGPISFGLTVVNQDLKPGLYNEILADAIVKNMAMNARWQIKQLRRVRPEVILFVDEPSMSLFGTAFVSLNREPVVAMLDEVFAAIKSENALSGVHCCGNTDWSALMETSVDMLNLDAFEYLDKLALYPHELRAFLDRGGLLAWGIVPNNEHILTVTPESLARQLHAGFEMISEKAARRDVTIRPEEFHTCSLITPSCGLGSTTVEIADKVLDVLVGTEEILKEGI